VIAAFIATMQSHEPQAGSNQRTDAHVMGWFWSMLYGLPVGTAGPRGGVLRPVVTPTFWTAACGSFSHLPELFR
jgi:hypothetical protein